MTLLDLLRGKKRKSNPGREYKTINTDNIVVSDLEKEYQEAKKKYLESEIRLRESMQNSPEGKAKKTFGSGTSSESKE